MNIVGTSGNFTLKTMKATGIDKKTKTYNISLNDSNNLYKISNTDDGLSNAITPTIEILKEDTLVLIIHQLVYQVLIQNYLN